MPVGAAASGPLYLYFVLDSSFLHGGCPSDNLISKAFRGIIAHLVLEAVGVSRTWILIPVSQLSPSQIWQMGG